MSNRIFPGSADDGVQVLGNSNVVANNIMEISAVETGFWVDGDHNVVRGNSVLAQGGGQRIMRITGTGNTLDGNIAPPPHPAAVGIEFTADGNFYGNNRMAAQVPFALGGTVQTNWGGNVGY